MDYLMDNAVHFFINMFDLYIIYRFMAIFFENKITDKKLAVVFYIFRFVLAEVVNAVSPYPIVNLISTLVSLFLITLCYNSKLSKKIITMMMICMCTFVSEALVALIIGLSSFSVFEKSDNGNNMALIITEIILWGITLIVRKFKNVKINMPVPKTFTVALIVVSISTIFLEMLIFQQEAVNREIAVMSLICVVASNFVMVYLYDSLSQMFEEKMKSEIVKREKQYYHNQSELLQENYEELRQFRHDIKNRILVMEQMLDSNERDKIKEYISQVTNKLDNTFMYSQTGNIAIDSIINYKLEKAKEIGAEIKTSIIIPPQTNIEEDDFVVILGNLLDNSIEAIDRLQSGKNIEVNIEYEKDSIFISVVNSYDSVLNIEDGDIKTRKDNKLLHGIGLKSVKAVVEKYDGYIGVEHDENRFTVNAMLYIGEE